MTTKKKINWLTTLFLTITPIVGIAGTITLACMHLVFWQTVTLAVVMAIFGGISITGGYHRLFSHQTYQATWPVRLFYLLFGAATFEGSVLEWCTDHRNHHLYTDTDKDPYSIKGGFWYAHIGWLFALDPSKRDYSNVEDLMKDPLVRFQHKFYIPIAITVSFVLPILLATLWGDWLGGLIIAGALRITFSQHTTFFINSVCHMFGKQNYSDRITARDNWVTALLTFGEGYHNFHHQFPKDYRNAIRFYQYDPTKWFINLLAYLGLASNRVKMSQQKIMEYKIAMDKKRLSHVMKKSTTLQNMYDNITSLLSQADKLERAYKKLKSARLNDLQVKADEYKSLLKKHQRDLKLLNTKLKHLMKAWGYLIKEPLQLDQMAAQNS